jgi:hypothetical protein
VSFRVQQKCLNEIALGEVYVNNGQKFPSPPWGQCTAAIDARLERPCTRPAVEAKPRLHFCPPKCQMSVGCCPMCVVLVSMAGCEIVPPPVFVIGPFGHRNKYNAHWTIANGHLIFGGWPSHPQLQSRRFWRFFCYESVAMAKAFQAGTLPQRALTSEAAGIESGFYIRLDSLIANHNRQVP